MEGLDEEAHHVFSVVNNDSPLSSTLVIFALSYSDVFLTPRSGLEKQIRIRDEHPQYVGLKILKNFDADPDPGSGINIPDPQTLSGSLICLVAPSQ